MSFLLSLVIKTESLIFLKMLGLIRDPVPLFRVREWVFPFGDVGPDPRQLVVDF